MNRKLTGWIVTGVMMVVASDRLAAQTMIGDFEGDQTAWVIPDWEREKTDHVAKDAGLSDEVAKGGKKSLKLNVGFSGKKSWEAAYVELEEPLNLVSNSKLAVDVYLPKDAPSGLAAQFCLSVGDNYVWAEQLKNIPLKPGEWTTIEVNIVPGSPEWKKIKVEESFRMEIQKIGVRVSSNKKAVYSGPIYIDNVRGM